MKTTFEIIQDNDSDHYNWSVWVCIEQTTEKGTKYFQKERIGRCITLQQAEEKINHPHTIWSSK